MTSVEQKCETQKMAFRGALVDVANTLTEKDVKSLCYECNISRADRDQISHGVELFEKLESTTFISPYDVDNLIKLLDRRKLTQSSNILKIYKEDLNTKYDSFKSALAKLMTIATILRLAYLFEYSEVTVNELRHDNDGRLMVQYMEKWNQIGLKDISPLLRGLREINDYGSESSIRKLFEEHTGIVCPDYQSKHDIKDVNKMDVFIKELKETYQLHYDAVKPIPYIRDRLYCVDKVFVESGIEYLVNVPGTTVKESWKPLDSYHQLISKINDISKRQILEGDPGYGKSTVSLQLVYDWCNHNSNSPLKEVKILIFLMLRELEGVTSIFQAIRRFILPMDSKLTEDDIKSLLYDNNYNSSSVLFILDSYDEYGDQNNPNTDVYRIIKRAMLRDFYVILTTRSSYLPKHRSPKTSRVRLTGFGEIARDQYIRKVVVRDNDEAAKIKLKLQQNPVLGDMCQIPLFFVLFAHMTHENKHFQNFNSVTSFFSHMISCFHSHLRNKLSDEETDMSDMLRSLEDNHMQLDEAAFNALSGDKQHMVWKKRDLCELLGQKLYDHYVRLGMLVENEVRDIDTQEAAHHIQDDTYVRFYHKLFCEWYAAQHLARQVSNSTSNLSSMLKHLDPFDLQYVYRFACGLNTQAAENIINYLQKTNDGQKFAILCILEQEGKNVHLVQTIKEIVSNQVEISKIDSRLLQRSTIQILEFASKKQIPIACLHLKGSSNEFKENSVVLHSGLTVPNLLTVVKIHIEDNKPTNIAENVILKIFHYSLNSAILKEIFFDGCLLPLSFSLEDIPTDMKARNIKVCWRPSDHLFRLNLQTGRWEVDDIEFVRQLCSGTILIDENHSIFQQRSNIQLLQIASNHGMNISCLHLNGTLMEFRDNYIVRKCGLTLPNLLTLEKMLLGDEDMEELRDDPTELTEDVVIKIFFYALTSSRLSELLFEDDLLPLAFSLESIPEDMKYRKIKVLWRRYGYHLNLQTGFWEVDDLNIIRRICSRTVFIHDSNRQLLQRCTILLLENASKYDVPIACLYLERSFSKIDAGDIILHSGLHLSCLSSVKDIWICTRGEGREMTEAELVDILMFVQQSHRLSKLQIRYYLLPKSILAESIPSTLKSRNVRVSWYLTHQRYDLNLQSGRWMHMGSGAEMTDIEYADEEYGLAKEEKIILGNMNIPGDVIVTSRVTQLQQSKTSNV